MGQRIDVNHENIYYGDFLAVEDVNISIEPNKVTSFIGPSGCGKSTVLRTLDRMHEIIPGAHVEGEVLLEGKNLYDKDVDPVAVRRDVGIGVPVEAGLARPQQAREPEAAPLREGVHVGADAHQGHGGLRRHQRPFAGPARPRP